MNFKRIRKIMQDLSLKAIYHKLNTSIRNHKEAVEPYLLKGLDATKPNQVWQIDITYLKQKQGTMYLTSIIDVFSRKILGWHLSSCLDTSGCLTALQDALDAFGKPEIINSDQGSQFTSNAWKNKLNSLNIKISMTGKGMSNDIY